MMLDLAIHFGPQVRYQCSAPGCRRFFKVVEGWGTCGCGTVYRQYPDGRFTSAPLRQAVPA